MTEHHAECTRLWLLNDFKHHARPSDPEQCDYCQAFRACEQRVLEDQAWVDHAREIEAHARSLALDAAREAVAAVGVRKDTSYDMRVQALAAIDALKEDQ